MGHELSAAERKLLFANAFVNDLPRDAFDLVASSCTKRELAPGGMLFSKGEPAAGVYALLRGSLRYSMTSPSGKETLLNILGPGKWIGDISTIDGKGRTLDCSALEDSLLAHWSSVAFQRLIDQCPAFSRMLLKIQGERIRDLLLWTEALCKLDAEGRLAMRLLFFAGAYGAAEQQVGELVLPLSQDSLANMIGTTRQRVSQILIHWQRAGKVELGKAKIRIPDVSLLTQLADLS